MQRDINKECGIHTMSALIENDTDTHSGTHTETVGALTILVNTLP